MLPLPLLLLVLLLSSAWPSSAVAQRAWKTLDWTVQCVTVTHGTCADAEQAGAIDYFEDSLEDASQWLSGLGFRGPAVEYRAGTDTYVGYISDVDNEDIKGKRNSIGVYYPDTEQLYLTSDRYFAIGVGDTPEKQLDALASDMEYTGTVVHELFHAVQYSYYRKTRPVDSWITEGMADAVLVSWLRRGMPDERMSGGVRAFDFPLHKPRVSRDTYNTSRFWRGVGKLLGSRDDIDYLRVILEQDLGVNWGLSGVDEGLRTLDPEGLYNVYPEFIAGFVNKAAFFHEGKKLDLTYDEESKVEASVRGTVREVATNAVEVAFHVPGGKAARLEIELANEHDDLHLIVDEQRADHAGPGRNKFRTTVEGRAGTQTFLVRLANVARDAVDSGSRQYRLDVSLSPTSGDSECIFDGAIDIEAIPPTTYFMADGKKLPIRRTESIGGVAAVDDLRHHLKLSYDDKVGHAGSGMFSIDIASLAIGGPPGHLSTRGAFGSNSPGTGPYKVELVINQNSDPGDLAKWDDMTMREQLDSGVGYPNRLAMRRLRGEFRATRIETPDCCVGYAQTFNGTFDAGNGPYHCEGGIEMMENAQKKMMELFNDTPARKPDPSKLDGLLN